MGVCGTLADLIQSIRLYAGLAKQASCPEARGIGTPLASGQEKPPATHTGKGNNVLSKIHFTSEIQIANWTVQFNSNPVTILQLAHH